MSQKQTGWLERLAGMLGLKQGQVGLLRMLLLALALGVLFFKADELFGVTENPRPPVNATPVMGAPAVPQDELTALQDTMARSLERTLSAIKGAGKVQVQVTLTSGPTQTPFYKTNETHGVTTEKDPEGGQRETQQKSHSKDIIMARGSSNDVMPVMRRTRAEVGGVIVVAEGARVAAIKERLLRATATALDVPPHRILVVPSEGR